MMKILGLLMKRPHDTTIKKIRMGCGLLIIITGCIAFYIQNLSLEETLFGWQVSTTYAIWISYAMIAIGLPSIFFGYTDTHLLSRGYMRIAQVMFGILLCMFPSFLQNTPYLTIDIVYVFLGIFIIGAGISGKLITTKGLRYGQKITKVRV